MERIVTFTAAYEGENVGAHGVDIHFVLKGDLGVVDFILYTNWKIPHDGVTEPLVPLPAYRSYHSPTPMYVGQAPATECGYLDGRLCYHGTSVLGAHMFYDALVRGGSEAVWDALQHYYLVTFTNKV